MLALMPKPCDVTVWAQEATPDGFAEVTIEVNGHLIGTEVINPDDEDARPCLEKLMEDVRRRC